MQFVTNTSVVFCLWTLVTCTTGLQVCAQAPLIDFKPQCITLGESCQGIYDGEVLSNPPAMVFSDSAAGGSMWVARLDPKTGLFLTQTGRDQLVASSVTPLFRIFNGGESQSATTRAGISENRLPATKTLTTQL